MSDRTPPQTLPRRDAAGRCVRLSEFVGVSLGYFAVNLIGLALIDGVIALIGFTSWGRSPGWLALILPALLFFDELRAWRDYGVRFLVALVSVAVAVALGLAAAALASGLAPLLSGGVGALVTTLAYALIWFAGIRWLTGDVPQLNEKTGQRRQRP